MALGEVPHDQVTPEEAKANFNENFPLLKRIGGIFKKVDAVREVSIPGVARDTAEIIISEIGTDMSRFPTANHLAAWVGGLSGTSLLAQITGT